METSHRPHLAEQLKQDGRQRVERGKQAAAQEVEQLADALDHAGTRLSQGQPTLASYATRMADGLDELAQRLRNSSLEDLARDTRQAALRNPGTYLLASAAVGFLAARFLKAGEESHESRTADDVDIDRFDRDTDPDSLSTAGDGSDISADVATRTFADAPQDYLNRPQ